MLCIMYPLGWRPLAREILYLKLHPLELWSLEILLSLVWSLLVDRIGDRSNRRGSGHIDWTLARSVLLHRQWSEVSLLLDFSVLHSRWAAMEEAKLLLLPPVNRSRLALGLEGVIRAVTPKFRHPVRELFHLSKLYQQWPWLEKSLAWMNNLEKVDISIVRS